MLSSNASYDSLDAAAAKLVLRVHGGSCDGQRLLIPGGESVIGSGSNADVCLTGEGIGEEHCRIRCTDQGIRLEAPEPGVHVNGRCALEWTLREGDWIAVGPVQLEVLSFGDAAAQAEPARSFGGETPPAGEHDDSHEIQRYMQALLQRVGSVGARSSDDARLPAASSAPLPPRSAAPSSVDVPGATPSAWSPTMLPNAAPTPATTPTIDRLRVRSPDRPFDLAEMRALANSSARAALHQHNRRTIFSRAKHSAAIAAIAVLCGAVLAAAGHFQLIAYAFFYAGATIGLVGVLLGLWCALRAAVGALRRTPTFPSLCDAKRESTGQSRGCQPPGGSMGGEPLGGAAALPGKADDGPPSEGGVA